MNQARLQLQKQYLKSRVSEDESQLVCALKGRLEEIRLGVQENLSKVASGNAEALLKHTDEDVDSTCRDLFVELMKQITTECSEKMIIFARHIMEQSLSMLQERCPCSFVVVAIGSLARGEATPYSDLEYLFLMEEKTVDAVGFFERLAMTSYFLIANLGETKLSYMDIEELKGWFDDCSTNGFKIDGLTEGAGNIPTGNGRGNLKNPFITTPQELLHRYESVMMQPDYNKALRGDLTAMLTYMRLVYSEGKGERMLADLKTAMRRIKADYHRTRLNVQMMENDVKKYKFEPQSDLAKKGYTLDVKKEMYRFPSILLLDLAIIYDCPGETSWDTIGKLFHNKNISKQVHDCLNLLLSCACYIRLSAYLYHKSHDDRVSVAQKIGQEDTQESQSLYAKQQRRWFIPNALFTTFCEHLIPLKQMLTDPANFKEVLALTDRFSNHWHIKAQYHYFLGHYHKALGFVNDYLGLSAHVSPQDAILQIRRIGQPFSWSVLMLTAEILLQCHEYKASLSFFKYLEEHELGKFWLQIAKCYTNTHQFTEALQVLQSLKATREKIDPELNFAFGELYYHQKKWKLAKMHFVDALKVYHSQASQEVLFDYYGFRVKNSPSSITSSDMSGYVMITHRGQLDIDKISYVTSEIINCVLYLGRILSKQWVLSEVPPHFFKCKNMIAALYGSKAIVPIQASVYNRIGQSLSRLKLHQEAMQYYKKAHRTYLLIHGVNAVDSEIAAVLYNQARCLNASGQNRAAYDVMKAAKEMYEKVNPSHRRIHMCQRFLWRYKAIIPTTIILLILMAVLASGIIYVVMNDYGISGHNRR